jgi:hypothetical protein
VSYTIINRAAGHFVVKNPSPTTESGEFQRAKSIYINNLGTWKRVIRMWIRDTGVWRSIAWRNTDVLMTVTSDHANLDIYQALADDPATDVSLPLSIELVVNTGVTVFSPTASAVALFSSSPFVAGSTLTVVNRGRIAGRFGVGGRGAYWTFPSSVWYDAEPGEDGGVACSFMNDVIIDNTLGEIWGGGGGGGGGGAIRSGVSPFNEETFRYSIGGSGGGGDPGGAGGSPFVADFETYGNPGNSDVPSATGGAQITKVRSGMTISNGAGGNAGDYGAAGTDGQAATVSGQDSPVKRGDPAAGGAGGAAILLNGNNVAWVNMGDVRGAVVP